MPHPGSDRHPSHEILPKIDDHVVAVLTREIQGSSGYRWARACDPPTAARFILGALAKVAIDANRRDDSHAPRTTRTTSSNQGDWAGQS